jgi:hypothetical protein
VRTFIVYLSIVAILVCPYDCAVKYAAAQSVGGENQIACCERCAAHRATEHSPAGSNEHQPKPADDGKSCLCEGAVFDGMTRSDVEIVLQFSLSPCVADTAAAPSLVSFSAGLESGGTPIDDEGGRSMRIAMRSLQL